MTEGAHALPSGEIPAATAPRRRTLQVGTGFAAGAMLMYFGALLGIYLSERSDFRAANPGASWIPGGARMELTAPTLIAWTLLISAVTMQWAVRATAKSDRRHVVLALAVTALFGVAVINQLVFYYRQMGLEIDDGSTATPLLYVLSGSFLFFLVAALIFLFIMAVRVLASSQPSLHIDGMAAAALFWYVLIFLFWVFWLGVFVAK